jgi:hypothetical protein
MTIFQVLWARQHDWFVQEFMLNGVLCVKVKARCVDADGRHYNDVREFSDYNELRAWAGY